MSRWPLPSFEDLTALTYVPSVDRLLVVADAADRLLVLRPDGSVEAELPLPGRQQEGIAFDASGALWVADDKDKSLLRIPDALAALESGLQPSEPPSAEGLLKPPKSSSAADPSTSGPARLSKAVMAAMLDSTAMRTDARLLARSWPLPCSRAGASIPAWPRRAGNARASRSSRGRTSEIGLAGYVQGDLALRRDFGVDDEDAENTPTLNETTILRTAAAHRPGRGVEAPQLRGHGGPGGRGRASSRTSTASSGWPRGCACGAATSRCP